jgi:hypothetical protein
LSPQRAPASKSRDANYSIPQPVIKCAASYSWTDDKTLELTARFVEEAVGGEGVILKFDEKKGDLNVTIERKSARGGSPRGPGFPGASGPLTGKILNK